MPDKRQHRGPHPQDRELFAAAKLPGILAATADLCWLLSRGYAPSAAQKLVGDRYQLAARQRVAVARCSCSEDERASRQARQATPAEAAGQTILLDGYNVLTTIEAALAGGAILRARDGCYRDLASMHGSYRKVAETLPALQLAGEHLQALGVAQPIWYLDSPVSNSGRLRGLMQELSGQQGWNWTIELVPNPDPILSTADSLIATADSVILNRCHRWLNLARAIVDARVPGAWILDAGN